MALFFVSIIDVQVERGVDDCGSRFREPHLKFRGPPGT